MHCREFRRKHDAFIDDTLSGVEIDAMETHRRVCEDCSRLDTRVRRALLLARNLPTIEPSADFGQRLQARLDAERAARTFATPASSRAFGLPVTTFTAVAAGLMLAAAGVAGVAMWTPASHSDQIVVQMAPVVASTPEAIPASLMAPTMVAAMPAGMPLWPAVFVAQEAPWHLASDEAGR